MSKWFACIVVIILYGILIVFGGLPVQAAICQHIAIPAYFDQTKLWDQAIQALPAGSIMIMNPNNGPGTVKDTNYVANVTKAKAKGIKILGYVYTSYGVRNTSAMQTDITNYKNWYGVNDIFFDKVADTTTYLSYYQTIANYVKTNGKVDGIDYVVWLGSYTL